MMSFSGLISTGFVKPNSRIEGAICLTLLGRLGAGIVRVQHKIGHASEHDVFRHFHWSESPFFKTRKNYPAANSESRGNPRFLPLG
jgi:hypothetical protein